MITSINGVKITNAADYQKYIQENPLTEKSVKITYSRDGQEYDITVTPKRIPYGRIRIYLQYVF